jgi:propanol-preferring alcohol dehydrogenase
MRAVRLTAWQRPPRLCEVTEPVAPPGGAVVAVCAAGLCHSDLHLMHWPAGTVPYSLPFTLGHEVAGIVTEAGPGVTGVTPGDEVLVHGCWDPGPSLGLGCDGGLADRVAIPDARHLVPAAGLDPVRAAPLTDAALTPYHAIRAALPRLRPGTTALVIGVGGLGHAAVQLLRVLTWTRIVAIDRRPAALALATAAGADEALDVPHQGGEVRDLAGERGEEHAHRQIGKRRLRVIAQVRYVLQRRDDVAAADAGHFGLKPVHQRGLRARDTEQQFSEFLG